MGTACATGHQPVNRVSKRQGQTLHSAYEDISYSEPSLSTDDDTNACSPLGDCVLGEKGAGGGFANGGNPYGVNTPFHHGRQFGSAMSLDSVGSAQKVRSAKNKQPMGMPYFGSPYGQNPYLPQQQPAPFNAQQPNFPEANSSVSSWNVEQACWWLQSLGYTYSAYCQAFGEYGVDGPMLIRMDYDNFRQLGIKNDLKIKKIESQLETLLSAEEMKLRTACLKKSVKSRRKAKKKRQKMAKMHKQKAQRKVWFDPYSLNNAQQAQSLFGDSLTAPTTHPTPSLTQVPMSTPPPQMKNVYGIQQNTHDIYE